MSVVFFNQKKRGKGAAKMFSMHMRLVFTCPVVSGRVTGQKRKREEEGAAGTERILIQDDDSSGT